MLQPLPCTEYVYAIQHMIGNVWMHVCHACTYKLITPPLILINVKVNHFTVNHPPTPPHANVNNVPVQCPPWLPQLRACLRETLHIRAAPSLNNKSQGAQINIQQFVFTVLEK